MDNASRFTLFSKKLSVLIGIMFTHAHKRVCWLKSLPIVFHVSPLLFQFLSIMATVCEAKRGDCALQWCRAHWQHGNIHAHVLSLHAFSSSARWCLSGGSMQRRRPYIIIFSAPRCCTLQTTGCCLSFTVSQ